MTLFEQQLLTRITHALEVIYVEVKKLNKNMDKILEKKDEEEKKNVQVP